MHPQVVRLTPPRLSEVDLFATDVQAWEVQDVPLAQPAEVATFATVKRREEHLSGRWLLGQALKRWGVDDLSVLEVVRDEHRAPSLSYIHGVWKRTPLPNISIAHSEGKVFVALVDERLSVGFDAEPLERTLAENAYDMMAKGEELERLRAFPRMCFRRGPGKKPFRNASVWACTSTLVISKFQLELIIQIFQLKIQKFNWIIGMNLATIAPWPWAQQKPSYQPLKTSSWMPHVLLWNPTQIGV